MDFNLGEFGVCLGYDRNSGMKNAGDHGKGDLDSGELGVVVTDNVLSRLPEDPFDMDVEATMMDIRLTLEAAMIGWFDENQEDLGSDSGQSREPDESSLNWVYNVARMLQKQIGSIKMDDFGGFGKAATDNVLSRLPDDPFFMNLKYTLKATFSGWFHENQKNLGSESDKPIGSDETLFNSLNWVCDGTMMLQKQKDSIRIDDILMTCLSSHSCKVNDSSAKSGSVLNSEKTGSFVCGHCEPHDAFVFVLPYLHLEDLISVERVCKSLHDAIRNDPFLWKTIHIGVALRERLTDDSLLKLTYRAEGNLQCLNLHRCTNITDDGLMQVLASNPRLTKLSIEGCLRLSATGMLSNLRILKSSGILGLKSIKTGGTLYFSNEQFEELNFLLGADTNAVRKPKMPRIYGAYTSPIFLEDDQAIDLEICPWCKKPGLLYDCPTETCRLKDQSSPSLSCRACIICVNRCISCGRCVNDCVFEELFCLAFFCFVCSEKKLSQPGVVETAVVPVASSSSGSTSIHQRVTGYPFCFYG